MFKITKEWFDSNRDYNCAINRAQAQALGLGYPPKRGWRKKIIGKEITLQQKESFEKNKGLTYEVYKSRIDCNRESLMLEDQIKVAELRLQLAKLEEEIRERSAFLIA